MNGARYRHDDEGSLIFLVVKLVLLALIVGIAWMITPTWRGGR